MFETAELGRTVSKKEYEAREPELRTRLLELQHRIRDAQLPVFVLVSGVDGAGKGDVVNLLHEWMDPRYLTTHAFGPPTDEERERPPAWRYWRTLAPRGRIGVYFGSWYTDPIVHRVYRRTSRSAFEIELERIRAFERMLVADGALIVKLWFHLSKDAQAARFQAWRKHKADRWRVTAQDLENHEQYDRFRKVSEQALFATSTGEAPWTILEATDDRYRNLAVAEHLAAVLEQRLQQHERAQEARRADDHKGPPSPRPHTRATDANANAKKNAKRPAVEAAPTILSTVDLARRVDDDEYDDALPKLQARVARLARQLREQGRSTTIVFEGWDAAGKGGAIRRITSSLDARQYQVVPIAAPTDEERAQHYLWRFWRHLPRAGRFTIYDRSWYGRVLVERVEGFAREAEWQRAYAEINDFEEQLSDHGVVVLKFWLHIDRDEQLRRFQEREKIAFKQYKITEEDYRNRDRWDAYVGAVHDMVERTSTSHAPWHIVGANDKRAARLDVLHQVCARLGEEL